MKGFSEFPWLNEQRHQCPILPGLAIAHNSKRLESMSLKNASLLGPDGT